MSKPTRSRPRQLSRAELKAYEARRTVEMNRGGTQPATGEVTAVRPSASRSSSTRRIQPLSRAEEFAIIRSDLKRLLWILAVLVLVLVVLTFFLR